MLLAGGVLCWIGSGAAKAQSDSAAEPTDQPELSTLFRADQADRTGKQKDAAKVIDARDKQRRERVMALYAAGALRTGADYFRAALILQHGEKSDEYLLAHEFAVVAVSKGVATALWLVGATEDRFLVELGRPQRFGTQYRSAGGGRKLFPTAPGVTDALRREFNLPTLAEAAAP